MDPRKRTLVSLTARKPDLSTLQNEALELTSLSLHR